MYSAVAAAAGLALADVKLFALQAAAPGATPAAPATFQLFTAQTILDDSKPCRRMGQQQLVTGKNFHDRSYCREGKERHGV